MNTTDDLQDEFATLAADAPADDAVRAAFAFGVARREKRRRTTALVAVAAAVVLVAGGIGVTSAMLRSSPSSPRPASIPPVVEVPAVPLPEGTQLIRHQLQQVTSPVTATPPDGLTGMTWMQSPGRLVVSWFDTGAAAGMLAPGGANGGIKVKSAGYAITDSADDPPRTVGPGGFAAADVTRRGVTVGDRDATLETAPSDAVDAMGFPAAERISWQLPDGRHIHVWATGLPTRDSSPETALKNFAGSITNTPQTLPRTIGIGLTVPKLTVDSAMNSTPVAGYVAGSILMCPPGVDPYAMSLGAASGSDTSAAPSETGAASSKSGGSNSYEGRLSSAGNPTAPCLTVAVVNAAGADLGSGERTRLTVDGVAVSVSSDDQTAAVDLGNGLMAGVAGPSSLKLSADDLAALAASVRVSPDLKVIPIDPSGSGYSGSASAVSSSAASISSGASDRNPPTGERAIEVDRDDDVVAAVAADGATATVEFTLRNPHAEPRNLTSLTLRVPGMTQTGLKVRLDNTRADADAAFQDAVLPAMFTPGARVRIRVELRVDQCSAVTNDQPTLQVEWQAESSGGGFSEGLPITNPAGGLKALLSPFCK